MNKILFFAGIIILVVLMIYFLFFIGGIGNFAKTLGGISEDLTNDETKFIGRWIDIDTRIQEYTFSSDGEVWITNLTYGNYEIRNGHLFVTIISDLNSSSINNNIEFEYYFTENNSKLHLKEINLDNWSIFEKK
jgi:hypothetical protein